MSGLIFGKLPTMQLKASKWTFDLKLLKDKTVDLSKFQKAAVNALLNRIKPYGFHLSSNKQIHLRHPIENPS